MPEENFAAVIGSSGFEGSGGSHVSASGFLSSMTALVLFSCMLSGDRSAARPARLNLMAPFDGASWNWWLSPLEEEPTFVGIDGLWKIAAIVIGVFNIVRLGMVGGAEKCKSGGWPCVWVGPSLYVKDGDTYQR
jgi:hypothetical protein